MNTKSLQNDALLTRREVADQLRYSIRSIDAIIARGEIDVIKFSGKTLIRQSAVHRYIERHEDPKP